MRNNYSYDDLVSLFDAENIRKDNELEYFYKDVIGNSNSVLDVPCATGFRVESLMKNYNKIICVDLSEKMLEHCFRKYKYSNVMFKKGNLKTILNDFEYVDDVYILDYAIYFLSTEEIINLIIRMRNKCKKLIIELFDYNRMTENTTQSIIIGEDIIYLSKNYIISTNEVLIKKEYVCNGKAYSQKIKLFNTPTKQIFNLIKKKGISISKLYGNYKGEPYNGGLRCIVVIEFNEE